MLFRSNEVSSSLRERIQEIERRTGMDIEEFIRSREKVNEDEYLRYGEEAKGERKEQEERQEESTEEKKDDLHQIAENIPIVTSSKAKKSQNRIVDEKTNLEQRLYDLKRRLNEFRARGVKKSRIEELEDKIEGTKKKFGEKR